MGRGSEGMEAVGAGRQWKVPGEGYSGEESVSKSCVQMDMGGSRNTWVWSLEDLKLTLSSHVSPSSPATAMGFFICERVGCFVGCGRQLYPVVTQDQRECGNSHLPRPMGRRMFSFVCGEPGDLSPHHRGLFHPLHMTERWHT